MPLQGEYAPSPSDWARKQAEKEDVGLEKGADEAQADDDEAEEAESE